MQIDAHRDACRDLVANGEAAFVFDVRGTGSVKCHPVNESGETFPQTFYNTEAMMWWSAYCLGDCLLGMRVFDALRAAQYLREEAGFSEINLRAEGVQPALWGYLAAALDSGIGHTRVRGLIESFESIARTPLYRRDFTPPMLVDGVLREFDLPDLRLLFQGRALELIP